MTSGGAHQAETDGDNAHDSHGAHSLPVSRAARDGKFIEVLGHYNPLTEPPTIKIEVDKAQAWIDKGAQPSNTVKNLLARARKAAGAVKA